MGQRWWVRLAIVAAIVAPFVFSQYCGITKFAYPHAWCPLCAVFGAPHSRTGPFDMQFMPDGYVWPSFALLRSMAWAPLPKLFGLVVMVAAYVMPLTLALYTWPKVRPRAWYSLFSLPLIIAGLGWAGGHLAFDAASSVGSPLFTGLYFLEFLVVFPLLTRRKDQASAF